MNAYPQKFTHCKADRKKETFIDIVTRHIKSLDAELSNVIDFSCYKVLECEQVLSIIDQIKEAG